MVLYTQANVEFLGNGERLVLRPSCCNVARMSQEPGAAAKAIQVGREAPSYRPPNVQPEPGFTNNVVGAGSRKAHPALRKAVRRKRLKVAVDVDEGRSPSVYKAHRGQRGVCATCKSTLIEERYISALLEGASKLSFGCLANGSTALAF